MFEGLEKEVDKMINFLLFCGVAAIAYILTVIFDIFNGWLAARELREERKKNYENELYKFKVKKILHTAFNYYVSLGYNKQASFRMAANYTYFIEKAGLVENKYQMIKEHNYDVVFRHKTSR